MNILCFGASGLIGTAVSKELLTLGHHVKTISSKDVNFIQYKTVSPILFDGVDVVINMVGIMCDDKNTLAAIHHHTPQALAYLAKQSGVKHWINLSALGANINNPVLFLSSKAYGDNAISALADDTFIVSIIRPSLIYSDNGTSTKLFKKLSRLSMIVLPNKGKQHIMPVHIKDVVQGIINTINVKHSSIIDFVGSKQCSFAEYLQYLRKQHHRSSQYIIGIDTQYLINGIQFIQPLLSKFTTSIITGSSIAMLAQNSISNKQEFVKLLGYEPLAYSEFYRSATTNIHTHQT
ncbi:MAG: NAD-dependent epimerase/dehydratase family protein [Moraxella sp.]|nr:NAD-dependent epimerase/dehydratase family protein [Moraxella sp.]